MSINKNIEKKIFYVEGMHCSSCELLIEKKLLKKEGIKAVEASLNKGQVCVYFSEKKNLDLDKINQEFKSLGYSFFTEPQIKQNKKLFYQTEGKWQINKDKLIVFFKTLILAFSFLLAFYFLDKWQLGRFVSVDTRSSLSAFFILGVIASVSSCAALVGGVLLAMTKKWHEAYIDSDNNFQKTLPHWLFHLGRLLAFFILGGFLGWLGSGLSFNNTFGYAVLVVLVSLLMIILALQMLEVSWAKKISLRLPKFITRKVASENSWQGKYSPFLLGVLTFFLPCGFTLIAQGIALTTGSFFAGASIMLFFALGTLPMLASISYTGYRFTQKPHLTAKFSKVAGIIIIFFAIYNINGQLNVMGLPSLHDLKNYSNTKITTPSEPIILFGPDAGKTLPVSKNNSEKKVQVTDDIQQLEIIAQGFEYTNSGNTVLRANVPTVMIVDNQGILGCGAQMAARGLFSGFVNLKPGINKIDLGRPKAGSYKITCSMGMVPPITVTFQ